MASSLPVRRLTDDALWARVARQARCADSGLDPDQPDRRIRNELPRVFRTGNLRLIYAAACIPMYSSMTSCGVRYPSTEWRRVRL